MKKFVNGMPNVNNRILKYKKSLLMKYKIPNKAIREADLIVLDGLIIKDRYNGEIIAQSIQSVEKVIVGGATPFGEDRIYYSF